MFSDTDKTIFVGRREDGTIYGLWTSQQWEGQEQLLEDHADVTTFREAQAAKLPKPQESLPTVIAALKAQGVLTDKHLEDAAATLEKVDP